MPWLLWMLRAQAWRLQARGKREGGRSTAGGDARARSLGACTGPACPHKLQGHLLALRLLLAADLHRPRLQAELALQRLLRAYVELDHGQRVHRGAAGVFPRLVLGARGRE